MSVTKRKRRRKVDAEKVFRVRTIETLIKEGRYDEAEEMLKNSVVPNTRALQARIDTLRAEQEAHLAAAAPTKRRMNYFVIALVLIFIVTGIAVFATRSTTGEYIWFLIVVGFVFIIPRTYRSASRGDALERYLNRSGYRRPGYSPRRRH